MLYLPGVVTSVYGLVGNGADVSAPAVSVLSEGASDAPLGGNALGLALALVLVTGVGVAVGSGPMVAEGINRITRNAARTIAAAISANRVALTIWGSFHGPTTVH
jgi:hypothetical protein